MADDFDDESEKESGSSLRKKYETALSELNETRGSLLTLKVEKLISDKGYKHLTVEDFQGVGFEELESKAVELEAQKAAADQAALRRVLESRGFTDSALDQALNDLLGEQDTKAALDRIRQAGRMDGTPPPKIDSSDGLTGPDRLRAAYAKT